MATISQRLTKWFSQSQDIMGLAGFAGTSIYTVAQYAISHNVSLPILIGGLVASLIAVVVPHSATLAADSSKLIVDTGEAVVEKTPAAIATVIGDIQKVVVDTTSTTVVSGTVSLTK